VTIIPAIDLMDGQVVRLHKGLATTKEVFGDALEVLHRYEAAEWVHVVDLDGAFGQRPAQTPVIHAMAARQRLQVGGGLRSLDDCARLFDAGVGRVVLGTAAVTNPALVDALLERHGADALCVAIDVKGGEVATKGWTEGSGITPETLAARLEGQGVVHVLCTAVHRDGTLQGPDLDVLARVDRSALMVQASGGIGSLDDIRSVKHLAGVILGKALLTGRFTLAEALAC